MNKEKRKGFFKAVTACTLTAAMLLSGGCGKQKEEKSKIAVITKQKLSFWSDVQMGAEDACNELGFELLYSVADGDNDYVSQEAAIQHAIKEHAAAIVIAPNGKTELNSAFEQAEKNGIKIININSRADYPGVISLIRSSDTEGGSVAARHAVEILRKNDENLTKLKNIAIIGHTASTAEDRISGFVDSFTNLASSAIAPDVMVENDQNPEKLAAAKQEKIEAYKKGIIKGTPCAKRDAAEEEAMKILTNSANEISVIFGTNTNTTLGICDAISELGLEDDIVVIGFNSDEEELGYIRTGVLDGTVVQNPYMMGYVGVRYAKRSLQGDNVPSILDTGTVYVDQTNLNTDFIQLLIYPRGKNDEDGNTEVGK